MSQPLSDKAFGFSSPIDGAYLIELYAGDYVMIEETFTDVLQEYDEFAGKIRDAYESGDSNALQRAVHKLKPLFGFVGLTHIQAQFLQFENACLEIPLSALANDFIALKDSLITAKTIISKERDRLGAWIRLS